MKRIKKLIYWTAILFIGVWLLFPILRWLFDFEFATDSLKTDYKEFMFFAIPTAILLSLFGTINTHDGANKTTGTVMVTIAIAGLAVFFMFMSLFTDLCFWSTRKVLYKSKNNSNAMIAVRDFGCGATDSGPPVINIYKVNYYTDYFIRTTKIDTAGIDKSQWLKVEEQK